VAWASEKKGEDTGEKEGKRKITFFQKSTTTLHPNHDGPERGKGILGTKGGGEKRGKKDPQKDVNFSLKRGETATRKDTVGD